MRAACISNNLHVCLSNKDLEILKKERQIVSFIIINNLVWKFLVKIFKNKEEKNNSEILLSKKFELFKLNLSKKEFDKFFKKGIFTEKIGSVHVYFYIQKHDIKDFNKKSSQINILFSKKERQISTATD